jgi:hypothetical protein
VKPVQKIGRSAHNGLRSGSAFASPPNRPRPMNERLALFHVQPRFPVHRSIAPWRLEIQSNFQNRTNRTACQTMRRDALNGHEPASARETIVGFASTIKFEIFKEPSSWLR